MRISDWSSDVCSSDLEPDVSRQKMHVLPSPAARSAFPYDYSRIESLVSSYVPQWRAMGFDAVVAIARGGLVPALMASTELSVPLHALSYSRTDRCVSWFTTSKPPAREIGRASCRERVCQYV